MSLSFCLSWDFSFTQLDTVLYQVLPLTVVEYNLFRTVLVGLLSWTFPEWTPWVFIVVPESIIKLHWAGLAIIWMIRLLATMWPYCRLTSFTCITGFTVSQIRVEECPVPLFRPADMIYCLEDIFHWMPSVLLGLNPSSDRWWVQSWHKVKFVIANSWNVAHFGIMVYML